MKYYVKIHTFIDWAHICKTTSILYKKCTTFIRIIAILYIIIVEVYCCNTYERKSTCLWNSSRIHTNEHAGFIECVIARNLRVAQVEYSISPICKYRFTICLCLRIWQSQLIYTRSRTWSGIPKTSLHCISIALSSLCLV